MNTKIKNKKKMTSPNTFLMKQLYESVNWGDGEKRRRKKIPQDEFEIPEYSEYKLIKQKNHNVPQLKQICRFYKQRVSGNKDQLIFRIYNYLKFSFYATKVQKIFRGNMARYLIKLRGPAYYNRKCNNVTDFMTLEKIKQIPESQFYSYRDSDGFIYGFDICSLYNLLKERQCKNENPYTRNDFPNDMRVKLKRIIKISKIMNKNLSIKIEEDKTNDAEKEIEFKAISIFQTLDGFGHVTDIDWFMGLNFTRLIRYIRELFDIWNYRAQLSPQTKRTICPPNGNPFGNELMPALTNRPFEYLQKYCLKVMERLVTLGADVETRKLGGIYVLGALTIVNSSAAMAFPWLYQSFGTNFQN